MKNILLIAFLLLKFVGNAKNDTTYFRDGDKLRQVVTNYRNSEISEKSTIDTLQHGFSTTELAMFFRDDSTLQRSKILINSLFPLKKQEKLVIFWNNNGVIEQENENGEPKFDLFFLITLLVWPFLLFLLTGLLTSKESSNKLVCSMLYTIILTVLAYITNPLIPFIENSKVLVSILTMVFICMMFFIWCTFYGAVGIMAGGSLGYALSGAIYLSHNTELKIQYTVYLIVIATLSYLVFKMKHSLHKI